jgi:hypothetical protein
MGSYLSDPTYLAPEYVQGGPIDARCDLYALGLLLFELLSGKVPFSGRAYLDIALQHVQGPSLSFASRCPELKLPPQFDLLLSRALAYAPEQRFEKAAEMVLAYERILEQQREASLMPSGNKVTGFDIWSVNAAASSLISPDNKPLIYAANELSSEHRHHGNAAVATSAPHSTETQGVRRAQAEGKEVASSVAEQRHLDKDTDRLDAQSVSSAVASSVRTPRGEISGAQHSVGMQGVSFGQSGSEAIGRRSLVDFPRQGTHAEPDQVRTIRQPEHKKQLIPQIHVSNEVTTKAALPAWPTQRERDIALLRQVEEYIWNEHELPVLSQTEPMRITPLGPLFPSAPRRSLSWRGKLYLVLLIVAVILTCIGIGAWGMEQFQHHFTQPVQPQQHRLQSAAQSDNLAIIFPYTAVGKSGLEPLDNVRSDSHLLISLK